MHRITKFVTVLMALLLLTSPVGCSTDNTKSEGNVDSKESLSATSKNSSEDSYFKEKDDKQTAFYHSAIQGAVIIEQDGSDRYIFKKKCDYCDYCENGTNTHYSTGGIYHGSFNCPKCNATNQFEIKTTEQ